MIAIYFASAVLLIFVVLIFIANYFVESLSHPKVKDYEDGITYENKDLTKFAHEWFKDKVEERFEYKSEFGYTLRGGIFRNPATFIDGKRRVVVMCHGYTSNSRSIVSRYGHFYWDLGFDIVAYDHRYHGESDKNTFCSMSLYESKDLIGIMPLIRNSFPKDSIFGLHGESMGSATIMSGAGYIDNLSFVVEDCGFSNMRDQMKATMHLKMHKPAFPIVQLGEIILKAKYHYSYDDVVPLKHIPLIKCPMLFMHGDADDFVPTEMVYECFNAKTLGYKEMHTFKGVLHAQSCTSYPNEYRQILTDFLAKNGII